MNIASGFISAPYAINSLSLSDAFLLHRLLCLCCAVSECDFTTFSFGPQILLITQCYYVSQEDFSVCAISIQNKLR